LRYDGGAEEVATCVLQLRNGISQFAFVVKSFPQNLELDLSCQGQKISEDKQRLTTVAIFESRESRGGGVPFFHPPLKIEMIQRQGNSTKNIKTSIQYDW
jgi:hypothetical protein